MKSGYDVFWTDNALEDLDATIEYLATNFSDKEIRLLIKELERTISLVSKNPFLFPRSKSKHIFKAVVLTYNTMFYQVKKNKVEILSFYSNRQNPRL